MTYTRFNIGNLVLVKVNGRIIQGTIVPYRNGIMIRHSRDLRQADEIDVSHYYEERDDPSYHYTIDDQLYARSSGHNNLVYNVQLPTGEIIWVNEIELLQNVRNDMLSRRIHNIHSNRRMNTFKEIQGNDLLYSVPHLPDLVNNHIKSYLTETPLSSRINTRINNRKNPGIPSSVATRTLKMRDDDEILSVRNQIMARNNARNRATRRRMRMERNEMLAQRWNFSMYRPDDDLDYEEDTDNDDAEKLRHQEEDKIMYHEDKNRRYYTEKYLVTGQRRIDEEARYREEEMKRRAEETMRQEKKTIPLEYRSRYISEKNKEDKEDKGEEEEKEDNAENDQEEKEGGRRKRSSKRKPMKRKKNNIIIK